MFWCSGSPACLLVAKFFCSSVSSVSRWASISSKNISLPVQLKTFSINSSCVGFLSPELWGAEQHRDDLSGSCAGCWPQSPVWASWASRGVWLHSRQCAILADPQQNQFHLLSKPYLWGFQSLRDLGVEARKSNHTEGEMRTKNWIRMVRHMLLIAISWLPTTR